MVAAKPQLGDRLETVVVGHHLGDEVTVIVDDGHLCRMIVIQVLCRLGLQNKVIVIKLLHKFVSY